MLVVLMPHDTAQAESTENLCYLKKMQICFQNPSLLDFVFISVIVLDALIDN